MKVLLDATVLQQPPTGVARATLGLYGACTKLCPALEVVAFSRCPILGELPPSVRVTRAASSLPTSLWGQVAVPFLCARERAEAVHFPWNTGPVRTFGSALVVLTLHDVIPLALSSLYFQIHEDERRYRQRVQRDLDRADVILTDSECSKRDILAHFRVKDDPVVVYPANLLPTSPASLCDRRWVSGGYFLYLGGYERRKGLDDLVAVYRQLYCAGQVSIPLVLVGEQLFVSEALKNRIAAGQAEGSIIETGYLADLELAWMLQNARGLVYPSLYEGFGYPPLEAMAQGCPVVTTKVSSMPEVCGSAALYVNAGDRRELADAILELNRNQALRADLAAAGRARAAQFSWEKSATKYLEVLNLRIDQKKSQGRRGQPEKAGGG